MYQPGDKTGAAVRREVSEPKSVFIHRFFLPYGACTVFIQPK